MRRISEDVRAMVPYCRSYRYRFLLLALLTPLIVARSIRKGARREEL